MKRSISLLFLVLIVLAASSDSSHAQRRKAPKPKDTGPKHDLLTLRYKPQAGTLLYNLQTDITQRVHDGENHLTASMHAKAQLAISNVAMDYSKGIWSFNRYFTNFEIVGEDLLGNKLTIHEPGAVNKITRFTYQMTGAQLKREDLQPIVLLNADAQTFAYFLRPPALLAPLPEWIVTYGDEWSEHTIDTLPVRDTVNIGITVGQYVYDVHRTYRLDRLTDSVGSSTALIVVRNDGEFYGTQSNSVTGFSVTLRGPLTGVDTMYLNLFTGRLLKRTTSLTIPVKVVAPGLPAIEDVLDVKRTLALDESNVIDLRN